MPLQDAQIADIVAYLHSLPVGGRDQVQQRPPSIVVGNAAYGERYFQKTCASCHSATGDLKGLAAKYTDPRQLQHAWLMPGSQRGASPGGEPASRGQRHLDGRPGRDRHAGAGSTTSSCRSSTPPARRGPTPAPAAGPKVEIRDRLEPHRRLVPTYADADIHNLTAYLVTLK